VAKVLGREIVSAIIGSGRPWLNIRLGMAVVSLRRYIIASGSVHYFDMREWTSRWGEAAIALAGPAANAACAILLFRQCHFLIVHRTFAGDLTAAMLAGFALAQSFGLLNLLPLRSDGFPSDGMRLLDLLFRRTRTETEYPSYRRVGALALSQRFEEAAKLALSAVKTAEYPVFVLSLHLTPLRRRGGRDMLSGACPSCRTRRCRRR
jgi:Zn-dependent protease